MVEEKDHLHIGRDEGSHIPKAGDTAIKDHEVKKDQKAHHVHLHHSKRAVHILAVQKNRQILALHYQLDERQTCRHHWNYLQEQHQ